MGGEWRCKVVSIRRLRLLHPHVYDISSSFSFLPVVHSDPTTRVRLVDTFSELRLSAQHTVSRLQNNKSFSPLLLGFSLRLLAASALSISQWPPSPLRPVYPGPLPCLSPSLS